MMEVFRRAHEHQGAAFVEVYQNCNVFNDGAFDGILKRDARADMLIDLEHGEPIRFGDDSQHGVAVNEFGEPSRVRGRRRRRRAAARARRAPRRPDARVRAVAAVDRARHMPTPVGVFRDVERPVYEVEVQRQLAAERRSDRAPATSRKLIASGATWTVGEPADRARAARPERSVEAAEHHAGARLRVEERRLLRHAHAARCAAARVSATETGRSSSAASATPVARPGRRPRRHRGGTRSSRRRGAARRPLRRAPRRCRATGAGSSASAGAATSGRGTSSASPSASTRPRPPASAIAASSASTPSGEFAPGGVTVNASASSVAQRRRGRREPRRQVHQPVDRLDAELVVGELDDEAP